ncbi:MAG: response regulator, partial [Alphaproteobacteria bacterium]|nr:response regulator [Alphaproteobacteria bacterium]
NRVTISRDKPLPRDFMAPSEEDTTLPDGEYVQVEVIDTGCGIPKPLIQKIFEPFFSTKAVGSGTGLGLSTVYGIIKQTGGYIYVTSKEGEGTTFCLLLRRYSTAEPGEKGGSAAAAEEDRDNRADLTGKGTILLVEDEAPVRIFSARALRNKGYNILEADSGETALSVLKEHGQEVLLIITDVIMPGMTGPVMIKEALKSYPDMRVIFISGYAEDAFMDEFGESGHFSFLPKPYTLKQLASRVKDVIEGA